MPICPNCNEYYVGTPDHCPKCGAAIPAATYNVHYASDYITAWGYVGYTILYAIPVIGFIMLLVHTFSSDNPARRSFARSYWCWLLLALIAGLILAVTGAGILSSLFEMMNA